MADLVSIKGVPNLYQRPSSGAYVRRWKVKGKLREQTLRARTITEAKEEVQRLNVDPRSRKPAKRNVRVHDAWAEFKAYREGTCKRCPEDKLLDESTLARYDGDYRNHIEPVLGNARLAAIDTETIHNIQVEMRRKDNPKTGRPYSPRTIAHAHRVVSTFLTTMSEPPFNYIPYNPAKTMGNLTPESSKVESVSVYDIFNEQEIDAIAEAAFERAHENAMIWKTLLLLAPETGMRISELLGLFRSDLDFKKNEIHVERQLRKKWQIDQPAKWFKGLKGSKTKPGNKARIIPMSPFAKKLLLEFIAWASSEARLAIGEGQPLFSSKKYHPIRQDDLSSVFQQAVEDVRLGRHVVFHFYRHTYASVQYADGASHEEVRRLLGHESVDVTEDTYIHFHDRTKFNERVAARGRQVV